MTADQDWIETSLSAAKHLHPQADTAVREIAAELLSSTLSQKALSKSELSAVATALLAAVSLATSNSPETL